MTAHIIVKRKVFAYITHQCRLLVFRHTDAPDAGIQVPAGTVEPGESPARAVMREAREETGLTNLELVCFLGDTVYPMRESPSSSTAHERHHRFFFHLQCLGEPPETWRHSEFHGPAGAAHPIAFEYFWAKLPDGVPPLIADHDWFISRLEC